MNDIMVVTICGSMKFKDKMNSISHKLELENGWAIIQCVSSDNYSYTLEELELLSKIHLKKIAISDAIYVINVDGYIGESTKKEIEYAKSLNKEIFYLE